MFQWYHLVIILVIVLLVFGTKKLRNIGKDVGGAVKGFKDAMNDEKGNEQNQQANTANQANKEKSNVIEGEVTKDKDKV